MPKSRYASGGQIAAMAAGVAGAAILASMLKKGGNKWRGGSTQGKRKRKGYRGMRHGPTGPFTYAVPFGGVR